MKKRVLLLATSCKEGGLCPGGVDSDDPRKWIRIVKDDGLAGSVQGIDIDFAKPLDVITFEGKHVPLGRQRENWAILSTPNSDKVNTCVCEGRVWEEKEWNPRNLLDWVYRHYTYHEFWGNNLPYLSEACFNSLPEDCPTESIILARNIRIHPSSSSGIYKPKAKIDFKWGSPEDPQIVSDCSMTDSDYYPAHASGQEINIEEAYLVVAIPKECWEHPNSPFPPRAYKFVSKIYDLSSL